MTPDEARNRAVNEGANSVIEVSGGICYFRPTDIPNYVAYLSFDVVDGNCHLIDPQWKLMDNRMFVLLQNLVGIAQLL